MARVGKGPKDHQIPTSLPWKSIFYPQQGLWAQSSFALNTSEVSWPGSPEGKCGAGLFSAPAGVCSWARGCWSQHAVPKALHDPSDLIALSRNPKLSLHCAFPHLELVTHVPQPREKWAALGTIHMSSLRWAEMAFLQKFPFLPIQRFGMAARYGDITRLLETTWASWDVLQGIGTFPRDLQKQREAKGSAEKHTARTDFSYRKPKDTGCIQRNLTHTPPFQKIFLYNPVGPFKAANKVYPHIPCSCSPWGLQMNTTLHYRTHWVVGIMASCHSLANGENWQILSPMRKIAILWQIGAVFVGAKEDKQPNQSNHQS